MQEMSLRDNVNVIVIDDDYNTVKVFVEFLELLKVNVVGKGYDGKDAVNLYKQLKPDIVFLDVMMPDFDGFYALENIKKINPNALLVMITADLTMETEIKLDNLKPTSIIFKPFDPQQITEIIDKIALKVVKS